MQDTIVPYAELMLCIEKQLEIKAPIDVVFESLLEEMGPGFQGMNGAAMNLKIEPWPGGRWFRDLGNNTGHLWGHVQVIKPPVLLEINGPMMMSYPAINHVQYRLTSGGDSTTLKFTHRAMGDLSPDHRGGVTKGWDQFLGRVKNRATR